MTRPGGTRAGTAANVVKHSGLFGAPADRPGLKEDRAAARRREGRSRRRKDKRVPEAVGSTVVHGGATGVVMGRSRAREMNSAGGARE